MSNRDDSAIDWKNIFYFMSYCIKELRPLQDCKVNYEDIQGLYDLQATILNIAFDRVKRFGLDSEYTKTNIVTNRPKGRIDFSKSISTGKMFKNQYVCRVVGQTVDLPVNQKLKLAFNEALKHSDKLSTRTINRLRINLRTLSDVSDIHKGSKVLYKHCRVKSYYKPAVKMAEFIIEDKIICDDGNVYDLLGKNENDRMYYIWEMFLRNFIREYISEINKDYTVEKKSYEIRKGEKYGQIIGKQPDISVYSDLPNKLFLMLDAKWYENPDMSAVYSQVGIYGYDIKDLIPNRRTKVSAVFGYHTNTYSERYLGLRGGEGTFDLYKYVINVNQDFEQIKQDVQEMVNEQLELSETA